MQGHLLVPDLAHQKYRFSGLLPQGQVQLIAAHGLLKGLPHLGFHPEKPVGRHHPIDALMGPEVVVVSDEMSQPFPGLCQVLGLDPFPKFLAHRGPKPFGFSHCLGMVGTGHHMLDPLLHQELLEIPLAPPGEVLPPLVGEHFLGLPEPLDP